MVVAKLKEMWKRAKDNIEAKAKGNLEVAKEETRKMKGQTSVNAIVISLLSLLVLLFVGGFLQGQLNKTATDLNIALNTEWSNAMGTIATGANTITNVYIAVAVIGLIAAVVWIFMNRR